MLGDFLAYCLEWEENLHEVENFHRCSWRVQDRSRLSVSKSSASIFSSCCLLSCNQLLLVYFICLCKISWNSLQWQKIVCLEAEIAQYKVSGYGVSPLGDKSVSTIYDKMRQVEKSHLLQSSFIERRAHIFLSAYVYRCVLLLTYERFPSNTEKFEKKPRRKRKGKVFLRKCANSRSKLYKRVLCHMCGYAETC